MRWLPAMVVALLAIEIVVGQPTSSASKASKQIDVPSALDATAAAACRDRALAWLVKTQNADGSWAAGVITGLLDSGYSVASFYDWKFAANALAIMALKRCPETPERRAALEKSLRWFTTARLPKRGSDWDNDTMWAVLYGVVMAVELVDDPRFADPRWRGPIVRRGRELLKVLIRNQIPLGGWAYYDDPPYTQRPKWGTSFCTALSLPALRRARELKWFHDPKPIARGIAYLKRCRLPNGAFEYDLNPVPRAPSGEHINKIKGSLGRIQAGNWSLRAMVGKDLVSDARIRDGLEHLFREHRFLDIARMRPIPHEAYYANAGYFYFFGHYYAAEAIQHLPVKEREQWHARLRPHITKTERSDGSFCDFLGQDYLVVAGTAYAAMTLELGIPR